MLQSRMCALLSFSFQGPLNEKSEHFHHQDETIIEGKHNICHLCPYVANGSEILFLFYLKSLKRVTFVSSVSTTVL